MQQHCLELLGVDTFTGRLDHRVAPPREEQVPFFVEPAKIAGVQSAEGIDNLRRGFGLSPVSNHHVLPAHDHLTHRPLWKLSTGIVYDQHLHPRHG